MHRVVPELIIENYRAGRYSGEFPAVGMFLDLFGFSKLTDTLMQHGQHGAEVLAGLMHGVFDPLVENIFAHGGRIVSFAGDGIMALFPIEKDTDQTVLHTLASAWTIQRRLLENPNRQTVYGNFHFSVKIGIARGNVRWGILHSADGSHATYYFRGPAVEESARAEHAARAGEIIITDEVYELLKAEVLAEPSGSFHRLNGFTFELLEPTPIHFPPVNVEVTSRFMPEEVITQNIRGEFRQIVNLFMRIPDLPYEQLQEFSEIVFDLRAKYGGLVNRVDFGDKGCNMLMLWGAPVTYENDIVRALNFILDLKARTKFPVTAGVTYYVAHSGYLGSVMYEDYTCYGWGVNLAARFMMTAQDGEIWIDERIARRIKNRFAFDAKGAQIFKGFASQQKVFTLSGRRTQEALYQGEFVGREVELPRLIDCVSPIWQKRFAGVTAIWGEAGSGKSRLVHELKESLIYGGHEFLWALCPSDQILKQSLNPMRYWLVRYFGLEPEHDATARKQQFDESVNELILSCSTSEPGLAAELDRLRTVLGAVVDLHWEDSFYEHLSAEGRYNNVLNSIITLVKAVSLQQPVLLVLEDVHFMDEDSQVLLERLKNALLATDEQYPIGILVTGRPADLPDSFKEALIDQSIEMSQLSMQELFDLAEVHLGGRASPELVHMIAARSEGNPYFAEQILAYLHEEHLLELGEKGWVAKQRLQESSLPADLRALLVARLDQVSRQVRNVVQTASVLGREFEVLALAEMVQEGTELPDALAEAEQANIWLEIDHHRYVFSHALLRDAAYAMMIRAQRVELHAAALQGLEKIYAGELEHYYGRLAHHAERARMSERALMYLRQAAKAATDSYQNSLALEYYTRALAFAPPDDVAQHFDIIAERVELYSRLGKRDLQRKDLDTLTRWAEHLGDSHRIAQSLMMRSAFYFVIGEYQESIECAEQAETIFPTLVDTDLGFYTHLVWSQALLHLGRLEEAMQLAQDTLVRIRAAGNQREEARLLTSMGLIALEHTEPSQAQEYLAKGLEIAHAINDPVLETRALNNLAKFEEMVNRNYVVARQYYEESYKIARAIGDRNAESFSLGNLGFSAGVSGDFAAARTYHEQALLAAREIGNRYNETFTLINLSAVTGFQRDPEAALRYALQAVELARSISERVGEGWAWLYVGHAYLLKEAPAPARDAYRASLALREQLGQTTLSMEAIAGLVETFLFEDDLDSAWLEGEKILHFLENEGTLDGTDEPLRVHYSCYRLLQIKQDPRAARVLKTAMRLLSEQLSKFNDETARNRYIQNIPWRRAIFEASQLAEN